MAALQRDLNLLVVEDNPGDFVLIEVYLAEMVGALGIHHTKTFAETKKALEQNLTFDAVLLDLTLPDLSGEPLVEKVLALAGQIPIIVLTGYENQEFGLKTLSLGVADYLLKDEITPFMLSKVVTYSIERNRVRQSLQRSEKKYRDIFDLSPQPMFLIDVESRTISDVNEAAIQQYGYTKQEFLGLHLRDIRPSEEINYFESEINKIDQNASQFYSTTVKHQRKNGEVFDVELSTSEITLDGKSMRMALAEDVTEKVKAEREIKQKSDLLAANAKVTGALIKNDNWLQALDNALGIIGKAVDVDRVYYFENSIDPKTGELLTCQKIEWTSEDVESELNNPVLQNLPMAEFPEIFPVLSKNEVFQTKTKDLPESEFREILKAQNIISILHFPIFIDGKFYGFVGFDDCTKERVWSEEEVQYLQTLGSNIASAIKIRNATDELRINEYKFKSMVEEGGDLIEIMDSEGNFKFISPNLEKILGWKPEEMLGKSSYDYIHPNDVDVAKRALKSLLKTDQIQIQPFRFKNKEGKWIWLKCNATNLLDDKIINGVLITATDITEQKYYNELQSLERDVLEKNALKNHSMMDIVREFLLGIEDLHTGIKTSIGLVNYNKFEHFCSPSFPESWADEIDGVEVQENAGSCGAAIFHKKQIIVSDVYNSPHWKGLEHLADKYDFAASWSQPIFDNKGNVKASFVVYYNKPSEPTVFEHNTIERAAQILRILFESEEKELAEQELALREKRFKALVQEGSDLIGIIDKNMCFKYVSPSIGSSHESYLGIKAMDLVHPDDYKRVKEKIDQLPDEKRVIMEPYRLRDHNGNYYWVETVFTNLIDEPAVEGYVANSRNVTEKIEREKELQKSLERYDIVNKATSDTIWDLNIETNQMIYNSNIYSMFGYDKNSVKNVGTWWRDKIHPDDIETVDNALAKVLKTGNDRFQMEYRFQAADGSYKYIFDRAFVIKDENGSPVRMIGAMQDKTQEREEEERLKLLESVITNTSESVVILNAYPGEHGREIVFVNEAFTKLTGYTQDEVMGKTLHFLTGPDTDQSVRKKLRVSMSKFEPSEVEFVNYKKNGEKFWINTSMVPVQNNNGESTHWVAIGRDITDQKQSEESIKANLLEKETLLAEIHHRVKNNLAVVSGMMQLQAFDSENEELKAKLYDGVVRIKTMATVHELLYQSNSFSQLEFSDTLTKLARNISETLQPGSEISLDIHCQPLTLNINQAIPASLIVNEVLTNAYKHAFKDSKAGKIDFQLTEKDELIEIVIKDDGAGFTEEGLLNTGSLGMHLIDVLSEQLGGENIYKNAGKGTVFTLRFERQEIKKGIGNANLD